MLVLRSPFNVVKFCRFCLADHSDIQSFSVQSGSFLLRTKESQNENLSRLSENENLQSVDGVKKNLCIKPVVLFSLHNWVSP